MEESLLDGRFSAETLDDFLVEHDGVSFYYDFGFPHAISASVSKGPRRSSWRRLVAVLY